MCLPTYPQPSTYTNQSVNNKHQPRAESHVDVPLQNESQWTPTTHLSGVTTHATLTTAESVSVGSNQSETASTTPINEVTVDEEVAFDDVLDERDPEWPPIGM